MALKREFQRGRSSRPEELIIGLVASIVLHSIVLFEANKWLLPGVPERQQETSQSIPIKFVEVPPKETPPKATKLRATHNSVAGGKSKPERAVSTASSSPLVAPKKSFQRSTKSRIPAIESVSDSSKSTQSPLVVPNLSAALKPHFSHRKTVQTSITSKPQPTRQKDVAVTNTLKLQPTRARKNPEHTIAHSQFKNQKNAVFATIPKLKQKPEPYALITKLKLRHLNRQEKENPLFPKSTTNKQLATRNTPTIRQPQPLNRQESNNPLPPKLATKRLAARTTRQIPSQAHPSSISGAASRLGGPITLSSRNVGDNYWTALPNSNRSNPGTEGIDARREAEIGAYLEQLQQKVRQQWIPGLTQHSQRTVLHFVVSSEGQVSNLRIVQPSGFSMTDQAAMSAVKRAAPFAPLPTSYSQDYINIQFTFNINVYGELELSGSR